MKNEKWIIIFLPLFLFASINDKIISFYKKTYPNIQITKIKITPTPPKKYKSLKILINPKRTSGNIKIDKKYYYVRIKAFIPVFVANKIIRPNQLIKNKVTLKKIPFRNFYAKPLKKISPLLVASKFISKNAIITNLNTKKMPLILKNSTISVIIKSKNITITSFAKALNDGYKGDIINILFRKKIEKAKVIKKGVVEITP